MIAMLVHLVRHGEVENPQGLVYGSLPGFDLSERGRAQALAAARHLSGAPLAGVWSSPLRRALRTAEPIAAAHRLAVRVEPDLIDWKIDSWTGIPWSELLTRRPGELEAYLEDPRHLPFAAETLEDLAERMAGAVVHIAGGAEGDIAVVGHQDPLQAARLHLTGRPLTLQHRDRPGHASVITLAPGIPWQELEHWRPSN
jgi:broad specificity phosphatase PhoE